MSTKKGIWITSLDKDEALAQQLAQTGATYGLGTGGHFWIDDLDKMEWSGAVPELAKPEIACWVVVGPTARFGVESIRQGLALLAQTIVSVRGCGFPILVVGTDAVVDPATLPTPLRGAEGVTMASLGPKLAARANTPWKPLPTSYRLDPRPLPGIGLWFEVAPAQGEWKGAIFGVTGAEVDAHGVGPAGTIPQRAVLEYPFKGMKLQLGETEYLAWGLSNTLTPQESYFIRVSTTPKSILFGELPTGDEADLYTIMLT